MAIKSVSVPLGDLTRKQLLLAVYESQQKMEKLMSELSNAVDDLKTSVDGVAQRILPQIQTLKDALAAAEAAGAADLEDAHAAVGRIEDEVTQLNSLGTDPSTPVDPNA